MFHLDAKVGKLTVHRVSETDMATRTGHGGGILADIRVDLRRLYESWMEIVFPRQRGTGHSVMGKWRPKTLTQKITYVLWSVIGAIGVLIVYPLAVIGFATRFYARKVDSTAARIGLLGVISISVLLWGSLTIIAHIQLSFEGFIAVFMASIVATVAAALAWTTSKIGGRFSTVFLAYPFAVTGVFLPPVVAAFYHPALADTVFTGSEQVAIHVLDNVLFVGGLNDFIRTHFDLEGIAHALMWFAFSFPVGWFLGLVVTLANLVRPSPE